MKVVSDGAVLACLASTGYFRVLRSLYGEVTIPSKAVDDLLGDEGWTAAQIARREGWMILRDPSDESRSKYLTSIQRAVLERGQIETFLLASEEKAELVLTESIILRGELEKHGIKAENSIGLLAQARVAGLLSEKDANKAVQRLADYRVRTGARRHYI